MRDNDASLVKAISGGDVSSFAELVARYEHSMIAVARAFVRDQAIAEEVCQETWLAVHQGIRGFKRRSSFKTWLFSVLIRQASRRISLEKMESPASFLDIDGKAAPDPFNAAEDFDASGDWGSEPLSSDLTPEEGLLAKEADVQIRKAIDSLPTQQRVVITLSHLQGFTPEEVCNVMQIKRNNYAVLMHLARKRLHQRLQRYFRERRKPEAAPETEERKP